MLAAQAEEPGFHLRNPYKKQGRVPAVVPAGEQRQSALTGSLARPPSLIIKPQVNQDQVKTHGVQHSRNET